MRRVVVFPHPEGPSSEKNSPRLIDSVRSSTATVEPKRLVTPSKRIASWPAPSPPAALGAVASVVVWFAAHAASLPINTFSSSRCPSKRGSAMARATNRNEIASIKVPIALIVGLTPKRIEE